MYVTNFSAVTYNSVNEPGKETSFEYMFQIDPQLAGHEFTLALTAFYQDDSEQYSSTFINTSFPAVDPVASFDLQTVFVCGSLLSLAFFCDIRCAPCNWHTIGCENTYKEDIVE